MYHQEEVEGMNKMDHQQIPNELPDEKSQRKNKDSTNALATEEFISRLFDTARPQSLLTPFTFIHQGVTNKAVVIPTDTTQASGGQTPREVDLEISMQGGQTLSLERFHHSYFSTLDSELRGWTLDLPTLKDEFITENRFSAFQLTTPLKSKKVLSGENSNGNLSLDKDIFSSILIGNDVCIGSNTNLVQTPDGIELYFDEISGVLLGEVDGEFAQVYKRNCQGKIITIEGWNGSTKQTSIDIKYGANGQVLSEFSSNNETVNCNCKSSLLGSVHHLDGTLTYDYYPNSLVKDRKGSGNNFSTLFFTYDFQGNLIQESLNADSDNLISFIKRLFEKLEKRIKYYPLNSRNDRKDCQKSIVTPYINLPTSH